MQLNVSSTSKTHNNGECGHMVALMNLCKKTLYANKGKCEQIRIKWPINARYGPVQQYGQI